MLRTMRYRLALDLGTTSIGWCLLRLDHKDEPCALIRAGVRIFSDGRSPKDGASLAVDRRLARQMRRRRDRLLQRKANLSAALVELGFWPADAPACQTLVALDPYALRLCGLDQALTPAEFGRALFHLNQRRGFQSNRKTDKKDDDSGLLKSAIAKLRVQLVADGARTVGEWLAWRHTKRESVRARLRGTSVKDRAYDLYIDRAMVAEEFDTLWHAQAAFNPAVFNEAARRRLRDILLFQRPLKPVKPGRCTLIATEERAPLALPSVQRFRMFQEVNHLRIFAKGVPEQPLTLSQRNQVTAVLERQTLTFPQLRKLLELPTGISFNLDDGKRDKLKGNGTSIRLAKPDLFGERWHGFGAEQQERIVDVLLSEPDEALAVQWLIDNTGVDEDTANSLALVNLEPGFGSLSRQAVARVVPELQKAVVPYSEAVKSAGFDTHSALSNAEQTGEVMDSLPYYGEVLERHVGFADPKATEADLPERRFGRIANPTVHIGLNELRKVVNAIIARYGHPAQVIVEVARELKQGQQQRMDEQRRQAERQKQNDIFRAQIESLPGRQDRPVRASELRLMRLWTELNADPANRRCPYSGEQISISMLFSPEVEEEHILPFSRTLDDSLNNKTVALRRANRDKGNRTPHEAFGHSPTGYDYSAVLERAALMPLEKRRRFAPDGHERWLREEKDFLARALTDTAYLARVAREYLSVVCPPNRLWVIPGRLTSMLRGLLGLNKVLSKTGAKNRDDHRHHAVDAVVIGITDRSTLQRFAHASEAARTRLLDKLVEDMPLPWPTFREHVVRAIGNIVVSHRPDHGHEGALHNATAYGLRGDGMVSQRKMLDSFKSAAEVEGKTFADAGLQRALFGKTAGLSGKAFTERLATFQRETGVRRVKLIERLTVIPITEPGSIRHGLDDLGQAQPYKGYKGDSNYCVEVWRGDNGRWHGTVISTFAAHKIVGEGGGGAAGRKHLRHKGMAANGKPLVMRVVGNDYLRLELDGQSRLMRMASVNQAGTLALIAPNEANVAARTRAHDPLDPLAYVFKQGSTLKAAKARLVTVSVLGDVRDPGFNP